MAVPDFEGSAVEVALTSKVVDISSLDMVNVPSGVMAVPATPFSTVHVTPCGGLSGPVTVAANSRLDPLRTIVMAGVTVTVVSVGGIFSKVADTVTALAGMVNFAVTLFAL
ncbi:hypothetical protein LJC34_05805, partial [Oscillospiraceae bacterium OttesenSCG-928-G22]|nr:hypothetical protein [Oscillospiraceae bacterium OttesenSCG-928-G22]